MQLSRFFSLSEMIASETAAREGIPNQPGAGEIARLRALCEALLDPLRQSLARAVTVNSGYRSPALNRRIGGAASSQHTEGKATDIQSPGMTVLELFKSVIRLGLPFDQLIYEAKSATAQWVHVSHDSSRNRGEILVANFDASGRATYTKVTAPQALAMPGTGPGTRSDRSPQPLDSPQPESSAPLELEYFEMGDEPVTPPKKHRKAPERPARRAARPRKTGVAKKPRSGGARRAAKRVVGRPKGKVAAAARSGAPRKARARGARPTPVRSGSRKRAPRRR